jgi:hypothetical protein
MIITRQRAEQIVNSRHLDPRTLRYIPGWAGVADAMAALWRHAQELRVWGEQQAAAQAVQLHQLAANLQTEQAAVIETVAAQLRSLGVDPPAHSLRGLQAGYRQVLDRLEARRREARLLGDAARSVRIQRTVAGRDLVAPDEAEDPAVVTARLVRDGLQRAAGLQASIDRLEEAAGGVDAYAVDAKAAALDRQFAAEGLIPLPEAQGARPRLDDRVAQVLASAGIDLSGD